jgi:hypothetical protein
VRVTKANALRLRYSGGGFGGGGGGGGAAGGGEGIVYRSSEADVDFLADELSVRCVAALQDVQVNVRTHERTDERTHERTNVCTHE